MARFLHPESSPAFRKWGDVLLALSFLSGLFFGIHLFFSADTSFDSLMPGALTSPVSIVDLLIPFALPFLFSAAAVYLCIPGLILPVSFLKSAIYGFLSCGISYSFGSSGWLVLLLFLFSDICFLPLLYLYWIRHISAQRLFSLIETGLFFAGAILISGIDYYVIFPFLQGLF